MVKKSPCEAIHRQIAEKLREEVQDRLDQAGVEVIEARISHLAYAQEIASAMLKRQQAQAIVAARTADCRRRGGHGEDGPGSSSKSRVSSTWTKSVRPVMVSNLLVVLCGEENAQPVLNTGSPVH